MELGRMALCTCTRELASVRTLKITRYYLSRIRTDIFTCHCDVLPLNYMSRWTQFRLLLVSFYGAGWGSRTLISTSAKLRISRYVKPAISSKHRWLLRTCCCYNKEYSTIVVGAPNGSRNRIYSFGPRIKTWTWISKIVFYIKLFWGKAVTLTFVLSVLFINFYEIFSKFLNSIINKKLNIFFIYYT